MARDRQPSRKRRSGFSHDAHADRTRRRVPGCRGSAAVTARTPSLLIRSPAAAAEVLIELFGDQVRYTATSLTLPGLTRQFKGFSAAARENGIWRVCAAL